MQMSNEGKHIKIKWKASSSSHFSWSHSPKEQAFECCRPTKVNPMMLKSAAQPTLIAQMVISVIPTLDSALNASKTLTVAQNYSASLLQENADISVICILIVPWTLTAIMLPHLIHAPPIPAATTETAHKACANQVNFAQFRVSPESLITTLIMVTISPHALLTLTALLENSAIKDPA